MALRRFMHPRNKYKDGPDFKALAKCYPEFCKHTITDLSGNLRFNFKNEESLRVLAKTLLKHDFNLEVEIPPEKLVPAMPLRLNYVLWIEDLLVHGKLSEACGIHGIDIEGTGAVCIYPLLCAKIYGWKMTGTEINEASVRSATENVKKNNLDHLIKVVRVTDATAMDKGLEETEAYSFTMCNPPFFNIDGSDKKEKRLPPRNAPTGNDGELQVEGGERQFVTKLIDDSLILKERVKIFTTMLGQKSSCAFFRSELKKRNIHNTTWTEFCQGHTKRWGLAWSFLPKETIDLTNAPVIRTREKSLGIKQSKDRPSQIVFPLSNKFASLDELIALLKQWLQELKIEIRELDIKDEDFDGWTCILKAHEDSWSHARRKRRMARQDANSPKKPCLKSVEIGESVKNNDNSLDFMEDHTTISPTTSRLKEPLLECNFLIGELDNADSDDDQNDLVKICMIFERGYGGKHALETFKQYLINKLNIREYLLSQNKATSPKKKKKRGKKTTETTSND